MLIIKCDCEIFIKKWNFLRIEPGFRDPETSTIELQPVTHISGDIDFDYSSKQLYQALIYNFYRIVKGKSSFLVLFLNLKLNLRRKSLYLMDRILLGKLLIECCFFTMSTFFLLPPIFGFTNQIEDDMT